MQRERRVKRERDAEVREGRRYKGERERKTERGEAGVKGGCAEE